mmetsp:Transcript_67066/g.105482  ORF Transcript_67066/g.105482 Transcript_67066/m.105482 type:complete len:153 (+) Transcript_67066:73-531(+)
MAIGALVFVSIAYAIKAEDIASQMIQKDSDSVTTVPEQVLATMLLVNAGLTPMVFPRTRAPDVIAGKKFRAMNEKRKINKAFAKKHTTKYDYDDGEMSPEERMRQIKFNKKFILDHFPDMEDGTIASGREDDDGVAPMVIQGLDMSKLDLDD